MWTSLEPSWYESHIQVLEKWLSVSCNQSVISVFLSSCGLMIVRVAKWSRVRYRHFQDSRNNIKQMIKVPQMSQVTKFSPVHLITLEVRRLHLWVLHMELSLLKYEAKHFTSYRNNPGPCDSSRVVVELFSQAARFHFVIFHIFVFSHYWLKTTVIHKKHNLFSCDAEKRGFSFSRKPIVWNNCYLSQSNNHEKQSSHLIKQMICHWMKLIKVTWYLHFPAVWRALFLPSELLWSQ